MSSRVAGPPPVAAGRAELLRALGVVAYSPPPHCGPAAAGLGLPEPTRAEHTAVFVLSAPPHAAIHLGADGKLGGEGLDRVAGFWRALGLSPPPDADHLGVLLMLYAELRDAESQARGERARGQLRRAWTALLWEHLWSWAPGYLTAVATLGPPSISPWALLALRALAREAREAEVLAALPLALRAAPPGLGPGGAGTAAGHGAGTAAGVRAGDAQLIDVLLAPVRSGIVLTREDLRRAAAAGGTGYRIGERRYTLQAMLDQDAAATLGWLSEFAGRWTCWHSEQQPVAGPDPRRWWAARSAATAVALHELHRRIDRPGRRMIPAAGAPRL